jgi:hypothetical protein
VSDPAGSPLVAARSLLVHDLSASGQDSPAVVDLVEDAAVARDWWLRSWPDGAAYVAGQLAQDVQEQLLEVHGVRWPRCPGTPGCDGEAPHELHVFPDLGEDSHWVCERSATAVAPLGGLPPTATAL